MGMIRTAQKIFGKLERQREHGRQTWIGG